MATIVTLRTSTPATVTARFSDATDEAGSPIVPSRRSTMRAIDWSRNAIANVVTSITAGVCVRNGRKTARSIASDRSTTTTKQASTLAATGHVEVNASV